MKLEASDRFQGLCLVSVDGSETIKAYDALAPEVRKLIRNSSINLCPLCLSGIAKDLSIELNGSFHPAAGHYKSAIRQMERMVLNGEASNEHAEPKSEIYPCR